jgi:tetratricopeptide (TPR) repeat protein
MPLTDSIVLGYTSGSLLIALQYRYLHDEAKAKVYFKKARITLEKQVSEHPHDFNYPVYCYIGLAYAGLGDMQNAVSNLKRAEELLPVEEDAVDGLYAHELLAMSYSLLNKKNEAIEEIRFLQQHVGYYEADDATIILKPDPIWDNLRSDPRFEKLWNGNALIPTFKI